MHACAAGTPARARLPSVKESPQAARELSQSSVCTAVVALRIGK